jgi:hypothetical protein
MTKNRHFVRYELCSLVELLKNFFAQLLMTFVIFCGCLDELGARATLRCYFLNGRKALLEKSLQAYPLEE